MTVLFTTTRFVVIDSFGSMFQTTVNEPIDFVSLNGLRNSNGEELTFDERGIYLKAFCEGNGLQFYTTTIVDVVEFQKV